LLYINTGRGRPQGFAPTAIYGMNFEKWYNY